MKNKLKGVNLGSWLLMEGYILGGRNIAETAFKKRFKNTYGRRGLLDFERLFRANFIREEDFKRISLLGANCIRVPFNHRLLEKKPFVYDEEGFKYLDKLFLWAKKYKLKVILDLHAAAGSQNCDWHADSLGRAALWNNKIFRERTYRLWEEITSRFRNKESLFGYDILNEPVVNKGKISVLREFYKNSIKRIRAIDKNHIILLEGNNWAQEVSFLKDLIKENIWVSIHAYQPLNLTFNFVRHLKYPGKIDGVFWNKNRVYRYLEGFYRFSRTNKVNIFVGEFGINYRANASGEIEYLNDILGVFSQLDFHYTYWTYKAVSNSVFPDGIYQYLLNPEYIKREGPVSGWENYLKLWRDRKRDIVQSWRTENYTLNRDVSSALKKNFKG